MPARRLVASAYNPRRCIQVRGRSVGRIRARGAQVAPSSRRSKILGFTSAYVFGAICPGEGKAAAIIMPICNTIAMD